MPTERRSPLASARLAWTALSIGLAAALFIPASLTGSSPALASARVGTPGGDTALGRVLARQLPAVRAAGKAADGGRGGPDAAQDQYDAARELEEALKAIKPVSKGCRRLLGAAERLVAGEIKQAEGVDRLSPAIVAAGRREVDAADRQLGRLPRNCSRGPIVAVPAARPELDEPRSGEAFPGLLSARVPAGTSAVDIVVNGKIVGRTVPRRGHAKTYLVNEYGRWTLSFRYRRGSDVLGVAESRETWLLPRSAEKHATPLRGKRQLAARLALLGSSFRGHAGIWVHDLNTGSTAGWNEDARFPAASTVKLAVLIAGLRKFGPRPERSPAGYDLRTLTAWSSNLAANRLLRELGGSEAGGSRVVEDTLAQLGAGSSSYTGDYRVGTALGPTKAAAGAPDPPPLVSKRVTTARDLGRILALLHAAAMGDARAMKTTRLTRHEARLGLGLLLASQPTPDNLGLFRPSVDQATPIAQKNGWLDDAQHTAGIVYRETGPTIVVLLTYRPSIDRPEAARLGAKVLEAAVATN